MLGKQLRLFHIDEQVGQGWSSGPNATVVRQQLQDFIGEELRKQGYHWSSAAHQLACTAPVATSTTRRASTAGHRPGDPGWREGCSCGELANRLDEGEIEGYLLKPMNCPSSASTRASSDYRDLPLRLAEFGTVYRWEQSGEIGGHRVGFTQDDAHLFCREDQIADEVRGRPRS